MAARSERDELHEQCELPQVLFLALMFFVGLTVTSKSGSDRWIYGVLAIATVAALIHFHNIPAPFGWRF